jgi:hypothetical protein
MVDCRLDFVVLYIRSNDQRLTSIPESVLAVSPEDVRLTAAKLQKSHISIGDQIPPKTGRRYTVVGGVNIFLTVFPLSLD